MILYMFAKSEYFKINWVELMLIVTTIAKAESWLFSKELARQVYTHASLTAEF